MVRVKLLGEGFSCLGLEFDFADCEVAGKFLNVALGAAVGKVKAEIETVAEPSEGRPAEPETRFPEPEEVPAEEMASVEEFF